MKKILVVLLVLLLAACSTPATRETFDGLERLSFEEYQAFLDEEKSGVIYFGWTDRCPDSKMIQENYLYELVSKEEGVRSNMYVVDLDVVAPDSLTDKDLRQPMMDQFGVQYGPTLLNVVDGQLVDKIEWTPLTADDETAIPKDTIDTFFAESGYLD